MPKSELHNEQPPPKRFKFENKTEESEHMDVDKEADLASGTKRKHDEMTDGQYYEESSSKHSLTIPAEIIKAMPELYYYM